MDPLMIVVFLGLASLGYVAWLIKDLLEKPEGPVKMREIADYIREGSDAFLYREIKTIALFTTLIAGALYYTIGWKTAVCFVVGAILSVFAAFVGMKVSTWANIRVAATALDNRGGDPEVIAYKGGAVTGLCIVSMSLIGISLLYMWLGDPMPLAGFGFGASLSALFLQLGGGIFTKAADVGADLAGKVEKNLPEDDPRNPAVIADLVGDNVGDCAGRGTDLFESLSDEIIATMILGLSFGFLIGPKAIIFPILVQAVGLFSTIIAIMFLKKTKHVLNMIYLSFGVTVAVNLVGLWYLSTQYLNNLLLFYAGAIGLFTAIAVAGIVLYYTDARFKPTRETAEASLRGTGVLLIQGMAYGLESAVAPLILIGAVIWTVYTMLGAGMMGLYGIAAAGLGILSMTGILMAADTFGPIADNADGIGDLSGYGKKVGKITNKLDAVGNTTKATTKGYAMASALMTSIVMLFAYLHEIAIHEGVGLMEVFINVADPINIVAMFFGASLPFLFSAFAIKAVGRTADKMVDEVRRQWKADKNILKGKSTPDYAKCVDISTTESMKAMVAPTVIAILTPIGAGMLFGAKALAAYLVAINIVAPLLALFMYNSGGSWDNAKKHVGETMKKKHPEAYKAAVVGDTLGDPLKDTAGPSLHILVKLQNIVAITLLPLFL
ncbi:MAG: sodium-translocating pyrophosphatase [Candidatus Altiarchaeota archaeon]|nr:sodium-translocating pyrophosphatase [Candidatus Altiarchaeota archaeon]